MYFSKSGAAETMTLDAPPTPKSIEDAKLVRLSEEGAKTVPVPEQNRLPAVRFLSVNGVQNQAKRGNKEGSFSRVSLHLALRFGMEW